MLLLQILDEEKITDSHSHKPDFKVCSTFICHWTCLLNKSLECYHLSNKQPRKQHSCSKSAFNNKSVITHDTHDQVLECVFKYFPLGLINCLDSMVIFNELSQELILYVVSLYDVQDQLKHRLITLNVGNTTRKQLADMRYSGIYGVCEIARVVRQKVMFSLAQKMLRGQLGV